MPSLLAVDLGLRTGLALYGADGRLCWYRSQNFGKPSRLRRAIPGVVAGVGDELGWLVIEGGGPLAEPWLREARRRQIEPIEVAAETWRETMLYPRQRRSGGQAKQSADELARRVIDWSGAPRPTSLRHDAAEAILVGLWAAREVGLVIGVSSLKRRPAR